MSAPNKQERSDRSVEASAVEQASAGDLRQALFREVNDQIQSLNAEWTADAEEVVLCECTNPDCQEPIEITAPEYETVRRFPTRFLVRPGHASPVGDRVIIDTGSYLVVEKVGPGAETAIRLDPRRAKARDEAATR